MNPISEHRRCWQGEAPLTCVGRMEETADTASFVLAAPDGQVFSFLPGQFISLAACLDGKTHWRAYSISSSPTQRESVSITVRRVAGGLLSNWLLDHVQPGAVVRARAPAGDFVLRHEALPETVALFSAGCGITPVMSMLRWLVEMRPELPVHFFHSARDEEQLIFAAELQALAQRHPALRLHLFLSRGQGKIPAQAGRLDASRLAALLPVTGKWQAFICGSDAYVDMVRDVLRTKGEVVAAIASESFTARRREEGAQEQQGGESWRLQVPDYGKSLSIAGHELLLDVLEREGVPIVGACRAGVCGSCKCRVVHGEVTMPPSAVLSAQEVAAGYVLACSARAQSDLTLALG